MIKNHIGKIMRAVSIFLSIVFVVNFDYGLTYASSVSDHNIKSISNYIANDTSLSIGQLGNSSGITLSGDSSSNSLFIPVDSGLSPKVINLNLYPSPNMSQGKIWATVNGVVIAAESIPRTPSEWTFPISNTLVANGTVPIVFHTAIQNPNLCLGNILDWVQILPTSRINFSIIPYSSVVISNYFPSYLNAAKITIAPPLNSQKVQTLLDLVSYLTHQYRSDNIAITIDIGNNVSPLASPFAKNVLIGGSATVILPIKGTNNQYYLSIGGSNLTAVAKALFQTSQGPLNVPVSGLSGLNRIINPNQIQSQNETFSSLGYGDEEVQGIGNMSVNYTFSQADLGESIQNLAVRLGGTHSPMISGATGYMSISMNGTPFYNMPLNGTNIDLYAQVPNDLLQRDNTLTISFQYTPSGGGCSIGSLPLEATIFKDSFLEFKSGQTLPAGFDQFPQNFTNNYHVYLSNLNIGNIQNVVTLVQDLQETTRILLHPQLVSNDLDGHLLYIGKSSLVNSPIQLQPFRLIENNGKTVMTYKPDSPFAALESYGSTLMLAGPQNLASQLLANGMSTTGWYGLSGDVVLESNGAATHLTLQGSGLHVLLLSPSLNELWQKYQYVIMIVILLTLLVVIILLYPRLVRRKDNVLIDSNVDDKSSVDESRIDNNQELKDDGWKRSSLSRRKPRKRRK